MIRPLNSLRFIFAIMIFLHHFTVGGKALFAEGGMLAVTFFFILSGFILTYSYEERFMYRSISKKTFYVNRMSKLYPLHILGFMFTILLFINYMTFKQLLLIPLNLSLLQSWFPLRQIYFSFNSVSWFSSDMLFFYLLFPWLISCLRTLSPKRVFQTALCILIFYYLLTLYVPGKWQHAFFYINPLFRSLDFSLGILLALYFKSVAAHKRNTPPTRFFVNGMEFLSIALLAIAVYYARYIPDVYKMAVYYWIPLLLLIGVFIRQKDPKGIVNQWLSFTPLVYLGEISFSFYMLHLVVIRGYTHLFPDLTNSLPRSFSFLIVLSFTIVLSIISFHYIEKPAAKWIKKKFL